MFEMRNIGCFVKSKMKENNLNSQNICDNIGCFLSNYKKFLDGRLFLSFDQLEKLSKLLNISVDEILDGDFEIYKKEFEKYNGEYSKSLEKILDIIDDYMYIKESLK